MTQRQIPKPGDFVDLLKFQRPTLNRNCSSIGSRPHDRRPRSIAKRVTPKAPFDDTDGSR